MSCLKRYNRHGADHGRTLLVAACATWLVLQGVVTAGAATRIGAFLGQVDFPTGFMFQGTEVGGLSAISYDPVHNLYYLLSDDRGTHGRPRFYTAVIDPAIKGKNAVRFTGVTFLAHLDGGPVRQGSIDPEGMAFAGGNRLYLSSEGIAAIGIPPFVRAYDLSGQAIRELPLPPPFYPHPDRRQGVRDNLAFESLALSVTGRFLYTASENALHQDGPKADFRHGSPARILRYRLPEMLPDRQYLYLTEAVAEKPQPAMLYHTNGLVELLCLDEETLLALERSFTLNKGVTSRLYFVDLKGADDISGFSSLADARPTPRPAAKTLLYDLGKNGIVPDNIEGMALGPSLDEKTGTTGHERRLLIMVSDNNFSEQQKTQFLFFSLEMGKSP